MKDSDKLQRLERELAEVRSELARLSNTVTILCRRSETGHWLQELTKSELAHWDAKPASDQDWWFANTNPVDRARLLRSEISGAAIYEKFLSLPASDRDTIIKRLDEKADEALKSLREHGFGS